MNKLKIFALLGILLVAGFSCKQPTSGATSTPTDNSSDENEQNDDNQNDDNDQPGAIDFNSMIGKVYFLQQASYVEMGAPKTSYVFFSDSTTIKQVYKNLSGNYTIDFSGTFDPLTATLGNGVTIVPAGDSVAYISDALKLIKESGTGLLGTWTRQTQGDDFTLTIADSTIDLGMGSGNYTNENGFIVLVAEEGGERMEMYFYYDGQYLYYPVYKFVEVTDAELIASIKNVCSN